MAEITLRGDPVQTVGELPEVGSPAPAFTLTGSDLGDVTAGDCAGKTVVLDIFVVLDGAGVVKYTEQVPEIAQEPDDDAALAAI